MRYRAGVLWVFITMASFCGVLGGPSSGTAAVFFEENFNGTAIDSAKWNADIATTGVRFCPTNWQYHHTYGNWQDVSTVPCYGSLQAPPYGFLTVANGTAGFSSDYRRTFPYIWAGPPSRPSPFPADGDFTLEIRMKYDSIQGNGDGVSVLYSVNIDPTGTNPPGPLGQGIYGIWADSGGLYGGGKTFPLYSPAAYAYHDYKLDYKAGSYSQYVDGNLVAGPTPDSRRPDVIWIGNPVYTAWGLGDWSDFTIDSIRVSVPDPVCIEPPAGIVGWWPGDGNAYAMVAGSAGTLSGGAAFAPGKVGQAFSFDGVDGRVEVPSTSALNITGPLTVDTWFQLTAPVTSMSSPIVAKWGDSLYGGAAYGLALLGPGYPVPTGSDSNGKVAFAVSSSGGDINLVVSPSPLSLNAWHLLAGVYDDAFLKLYVDGALVAEQAYAAGIHATSAPLVMGSYDPAFTSFTGPLQGMIDEAEIFNRALAPEEIAALYHAGSAGKCRSNYVPVANAGPDQSVEMTSCAGASVTLDGSASFDPDGDTLTYAWSENGVAIASGTNPTVTLPFGDHTITLTVDDGKGGTSSATTTIHVKDTIPPVLTVTVNPSVLWPPNHQYVKITPTITVQDACVETTRVELVSVTSSEPDNGLGDGDTSGDIVINSDGTASLRAERSGKGNGRVYTLTYKATDRVGNSVTAIANVIVPHDRR